jgi:50S ribosomal protein L16 3-hydroxylase
MQDRLPGGLAAGEFLRRHWQKKPLLVRGAMRDLGCWPGKRGLFSLAQRTDVESRLVARSAGRWTVRHGPIARAVLARQPQRDWTLLVNGVNLHCEPAERLLRRFAFVPQARLDDVMVSFAAPGGGVGAHYDGYDVFLLQASGRRVWRLERARRFAPVPGAPLRLIADFHPQEEFLLEPGDLLYLPPGWGHEGVALDESWTYSIGFRAPRRAELAAAFLDYLHERGFAEREYRDPGLRPAAHPARIERRMLRFAEDALRQIRWSRRDAEAFLGRHLTMPKHHVVFRPPAHPRSRRAFLDRLARGDAVLDARTQLLYRGARFFVNGEAVILRARQRRSLARLADFRRLDGRELARAGLGVLLYDWYRDGYLNLERDT